MEGRPKTVYTRGAEDGLVMGILLSLMFIFQAVGVRFLPLLLLGDLMMLAVPVLLFVMLRRSNNIGLVPRSFSELWLQGIIIFLSGCIIMSAVVYIYLRIINPDFIVSQVAMVADVYRQQSTPEAIEMADMLTRIIDRHLLPSPIELAFTLIWFGSFTGAILSMVEALIIKSLKRTKKTNS